MMGMCTKDKYRADVSINPPTAVVARIITSRKLTLQTRPRSFGVEFTFDCDLVGRIHLLTPFGIEGKLKYRSVYMYVMS